MTKQPLIPTLITVLSLLNSTAYASSELMCSAQFTHQAASETHEKKGEAKDESAEAPKPTHEDQDLIPSNVVFDGIRLKAMPVLDDSKLSANDPAYQAQSNKIVGMLGSTLFENIGRKLTGEKGTLKLGQMIGGGRSVEFWYVADFRDEKTFKLNRIVYIEPSGNENVVEKDALTDDGKRLAKQNIVFSTATSEVDGETQIDEIKPLDRSDLESWFEPAKVASKPAKKPGKPTDVETFLKKSSAVMTPNDQAKIADLDKNWQTVEVPLVIKGRLLSRVMQWKNIAQFVDRAQIREIGLGGGDKMLLTKAKMTGFMNMMSATYVKQGLKWGVYVTAAGLVFGTLCGVAYVTTGQTPKLKLPSVLGSVQDMIEQMTKQKMSKGQAKQAKAALAQLNGFQVDQSLIAQIDQRTDLKDIPKNVMGDEQSYVAVTSALLSREHVLGGEATYVVTDTTMQTGSVEKGPDRVVTTTGYLVAEYPKLQLIALTPISQKSDAKGGMPFPLLLIDRAHHAQTYDAISGSIAHLSQQAAQPAQR